MDILPYVERRVFSQNGEDGILEYIFSAIPPTCRVCVEIGVGNGLENNTRKLTEIDGWSGYWFSMEAVAQTPPTVKFVQSKVTVENVEPLLKESGVPERFDLLSVDIDGNDYWVWKAIERWRPQVVVVEYNGLLVPPLSQTIVYEPDFQWNGSRYFGASLCALSKLAIRKGYSLAYCDSRGVNAFFVERQHGPFRGLEDVFKPLSYSGYRDDARSFQDV
jgi:hypothetical protein